MRRRSLRADPLRQLESDRTGRDDARRAAAFIRGKYLLRPGVFEAARISLTGAGASIANATFAALTFSPGVTDYDTVLDDVHGNTDRAMADLTAGNLVIRSGGIYLVTASISWPANATGIRRAQIRRDSTAVGEVLISGVATYNAHTRVTVVLEFAVDDIVELRGFQTSGGGLAPQSADGGTFLSAHWVAGVAS